MPIITVSLFGRTQREKDRLAESISESVCKILAVDKKEVPSEIINGLLFPDVSVEKYTHKSVKFSIPFNP